jgi:hypothetical protein
MSKYFAITVFGREALSAGDLKDSRKRILFTETHAGEKNEPSNRTDSSLRATWLGSAQLSCLFPFPSWQYQTGQGLYIIHK